MIFANFWSLYIKFSPKFGSLLGSSGFSPLGSLVGSQKSQFQSSHPGGGILGTSGTTVAHQSQQTSLFGLSVGSSIGGSLGSLGSLGSIDPEGSPG